jgi:hypothetical protein
MKPASTRSLAFKRLSRLISGYVSGRKDVNDAFSTNSLGHAGMAPW